MDVFENKVLDNRNCVIDISRGIAIILVVIGHAINDPTKPVNKVILSFHMPLFFIISGIVFNPSSIKLRKINDFLIGKVKRLLVPQLTLGSIEIAYLFCLVLAGYKTDSVDCFYAVARWWFLPVMFQISIISYFFARMGIFDSFSKKMALFFFTVSISLIVIFFLKDIDGTYILYCNVLPIAYFFFLIGFFLKKILLSMDPFVNKIVIVVGSFIVIVVAMINSPIKMYNNEYGNIFLFIVTSLAGSIVVIKIATLINSTILIWCGQNSMIIYVVQFHINIAVRIIITKLLHFDLVNNVLSDCICVIISLIITMFVSVLFKKYIPWPFGLTKKDYSEKSKVRI